MFLAAIAATVLMAVVSYQTIDRDLSESALSRRSSISFLAANLLTEKFDRLIDIGVSLASRVRFRELVDAGDWTAAGKILAGVPSDFPSIERITLHDLRGTLVADVPVISAMSGQNFAHRDWFQAVTKTRQPYISRVYLRTAPPQFNVFVAAIPIKNSGGELRAILVLQIRLDRFFEWIKSVDTGPRGAIYIVDSHGTLASHPNAMAQGQLVDYSAVPVVQQLLRNERGVEAAYNPIEKETRVVAFEPVPKYHWGVVLEQPESIVFASRDDQLRRILFVYAAILALMTAIAYLARRVAAERRQSREAQVRQSAVLQSILDSLGDGVIVTDEDFNVRLINPVARRMIGLRPEEPPPVNWATVPGRYLPDMITPVPTDRLFIARALRGENVNDEELFIRNPEFPDGIWVSGTARPVANPDGKAHAVLVWRDITERRRAEDKIIRLSRETEERASQLDAANKELESFTYTVSHDLRSPLRAIDGFSKIVEDEYGSQFDDEGKRLLGVIRANAQKMAVLIDDLLEFSRLGRRRLAMDAIDMNQLVEEACQEVRAATNTGAVKISMAPLPEAWGDRALLKQVWVNFLSNAIKFSGKSAAPEVSVSGHRLDDENIYAVKDNGVGFDMRYYNKLFGVFQRLHGVTDFPGTGVGLAIIHRVVSRHGGRVWAESTLNQGATFFFSLHQRGAQHE